MTSIIETGLNTTDNATVAVVSCNASTSTILKVVNVERLNLIIDNGDNIQDLWVKLQTAATDNNKEWILVPKGERWSMAKEFGNIIFTGEVSGIFNVGAISDVQVIELTRD